VAANANHPVVELVALVASAGGLEALSTVLRDLPIELPAAIVVQQHLGGHDSVLPAILGRQAAREVAWARDGQTLAPGEVVVCPPAMHLELTPDGCCRLRMMGDLGERRFDVMLSSLAASYGPRGLGVVLSGSGQDGAVGTAEMKRAGAVVIAESPETAQYRSMPVAAARAGADLVLPVHEIGRVVADLVAGAPLPVREPCESPAEANPMGNGDPNDPWPNDFPQLWPNSVNSAATRGEFARLRAVELRRRRQDLSSGFGATAQTVATAQRRADESRRRAQLAHQAAEEAAARWGQREPIRY
jgi:two-component system, chemotaxis family, protein-glutamate methylesterase/glutaminase